MGRSPCCSKEGLNRGAWTALEDKILTTYIKAHGEGKWRNLPKKAGLKRCGKSCRLRWLNYLRPDIKRGNISHDEEDLIIRLHNLLGNRWSLIAGRLPGRTDNEIKNYWNTTLGKRAAQASSPTSAETPSSKSGHKKVANESQVMEPSNSPQATENKVQVIRTKATRCSSKVLVPLQPPPTRDIDIDNLTLQGSPELQDYQPYLTNHQEMDNTAGAQSHHGTAVLDELYSHGQDFFNFEINDDQLQASNGEESEENNGITKNLPEDPVQPLPFDEAMFKDLTANPCLVNNVAMDLDSLAFFLDSDEWL